MRTMLTAMLLAGAISSTALCDDGDFQWQGKLASGQLLEVRGLWGAIHAEGTSDGTASVTAHKTGNASDPAAVSIQVVPFNGGVVFCAIYPDAGQDHPNTCGAPGQDTYLNKDGKNDVQVEFTIKVPKGVRLSAITQKGEVQATSLAADVDASTLDGDVTISTTGATQANTMHGSITASIGSVNWSGLRSFTTRGGNMDLQIPADANVTVSANVFNGVLTSDFSLMTTSPSMSLFVMASGTLGTDGRSLHLLAFNGNITLHQGPASNR